MQLLFNFSAAWNPLTLIQRLSELPSRPRSVLWRGFADRRGGINGIWACDRNLYQSGLNFKCTVMLLISLCHYFWTRKYIVSYRLIAIISSSGKHSRKHESRWEEEMCRGYTGQPSSLLIGSWDRSLLLFFSLRFFCSRWCGKFSLSLCQIHFQDDFLAQLQSVTRSPITGRKERDGELYTPPHSVNIISRQFVLHNLTPSVKKCGARGEERREESGLLCSWCHFSYWSWVVK